MGKAILILTACLVLFSVTGTAQKRKPKQPPKPVSTPTSERFVPCPGYNFEIRIDADKTQHLEVLTGYEYQDLDNGLLKKALSEYVSMQTPHPLQKPVGPNVVIRPDISLDLKTVVDVARTSRVAETAEVSIVVADGPDLEVPVDPRFLKFRELKPNPLYLIVTLHEDGAVDLNNEAAGSLTDTSPLAARLKKIFGEREINGVFREGSYEIEKTVNISAFAGAKFTAVITLAKAIEAAGAAPIRLEIDSAEVQTVLSVPPIIK